VFGFFKLVFMWNGQWQPIDYGKLAAACARQQGKGGGKGGKGGKGGGGGKGGKTPPWQRQAGKGQDPDLLDGPRSPPWGCSKCGEAANWANRLRCRTCGQPASQSHQNKAREAAKKAGKASNGGGGARGTPAGHKVVSPDLSFAEAAKHLGGLVDNPELLDQLRPKPPEPGPAEASKVKVAEPKDLSSALQLRRQLQARRDKAQKDIEKREKSISEQQAALEEKKQQQEELDDQIGQYSAFVRRFETIDVTGASGAVGHLALVLQMLVEVKKELPGADSGIGEIEKQLEALQLKATADSEAAAAAAAAAAAPTQADEAMEEDGGGRSVCPDLLDKMLAAAGATARMSDADKRKMLDAAEAEDRARKQQRK